MHPGRVRDLPFDRHLFVTGFECCLCSSQRQFPLSVSPCVIMANTTQAPRSAATEENATPSANKPVAQFRHQDATASVFMNPVQTKSGATVSLPGVTIQRGYRDKEGNRGYTHTFRRDDLLPAAFALLKAYSFITERAKEDEPNDA